MKKNSVLFNIDAFIKHVVFRLYMPKCDKHIMAPGQAHCLRCYKNCSTVPRETPS